MTRQRFRELVAALPSEAPYFLTVFGSPPGRRASSPAERQAAAESDPAFFWNLVLSYVQAGQPLPDLPWPAEILRLFRHLSDPNYYDPNLVEAEMFSLPENQRTRDLICALILCRGRGIVQRCTRPFPSGTPTEAPTRRRLSRHRSWPG